VDEIICHGIPDSRELQPGDILNVDVSSYLDGVHGDLNETVFVDRPQTEEAVRIVHCAYECLRAGYSTVSPGNLYRHVGDAITAKADQYGCSVVRTYSGHGVGDKFHTAPTIAHYANNKSPGVMAEGHIFTIEPMINIGTWKDVTWPDKWTSATVDGQLSAQFEHTMVVTKGGFELLTNWRDGVPTYQKQLDTWGIPLPQPRSEKEGV
jgi:methionyl aminopeptidase